MGVVTQVLECIENSMELLLDLNKKLYGEDDDEDEDDTVEVEGKVEDVFECFTLFKFQRFNSFLTQLSLISRT